MKKIVIIVVSILVVVVCAIAAFLIWYFGKNYSFCYCSEKRRCSALLKLEI